MLTVSRTAVSDAPPLPDTYAGETEPTYVVIEVIEPPGMLGPQPYVHPTREEAFFVLEGDVTLHIGEERMHARPGAFALVPRGVPHTFENTGTHAARVRVLSPSSGVVPHFAERAAQCTPPDDQFDLAAIAAIVAAAHAHGPEFLASLPRTERGARRHLPR